MTHLRKMMLEELQRRNYSDRTANGYVRTVAAFAKHFGKPPDKLGPDDERTIEFGYRITWPASKNIIFRPGN